MLTEERCARPRSIRPLGPVVRLFGQPRRAFMPVVGLLLVASFMTIPGALLARDAANVRTVTVADGISNPIRVGDMLAQGRLVGNGASQFCEMPTTMVGSVGSGSGVAASTFQITSDCRLLVVAIEVQARPPDTAAAGSDSMKPTDSQGVRTFETVGGRGGQ